MSLAPTFLTFPAQPVGLSWQSIAVDRSQATAAAFNLNTISRGGGGDVLTATRWSAKVGIGAEAAAMFDGMLCNSVGGASARALLYSLPLRIFEAFRGNVGCYTDTVILDCLIQSTGPGADTGVFLLQSDGTIAGTPLPSAGGVGFGFRPDTNGVDLWASGLGSVGHSPAPFLPSLYRCTLTVRSARMGQAGGLQMAVNGVPLFTSSLINAMGAGPNQGYAAGRSLLLPVVSCGGGNLFVADLSILNTEPGFI